MKQQLSDTKLARIFLIAGAACTLVGMVLSPLDLENWSVSFSMVGVVAALAGIYLAFEIWKQSMKSQPEESTEESSDAQR